MRRSAASTASIRRRLLAGLIWGTVVAAAEAFSQPLVTTPLAAQLLAFSSLLIGFCLSGCVFALVLPPAAERLRPPLLITAFVGLSMLFAGLMTVMLVALARYAPPAINIFVASPDVIGIYLHTLFPHLFFGGVVMAAYQLSRRVERTRSFIARSMIAVAEGEASQFAASARDLRGQIRPDRIGQVLVEIRRRYRLEIGQGDGLLERLTAFLRAAMPGVRAGRSTLAAELDILEQFRLLTENAGGAPASWRAPIRGPAWVSAPFPPLALLQLVETLPPGLSPPVEVRLSRRGDTGVLGLFDPGGSLAGAWPTLTDTEALRRRWRAFHGERGAFSAGDGALVELSFALARPAADSATQAPEAVAG